MRGHVFDAEYLGTTQIVTVDTADNVQLKARVPSDVAVRPGDLVGLALRPEKLPLFEEASGRALRTALHEGARAWLRSCSQDVSKRFGATQAVRRSFAAHRRRRVRGAAGPDRRRQDHDAAPRRRPGDARCRPRRASAGATSPASRRQRATWRSCSSSTRSIRTSSVYDNLAFPLRSPARRLPEDEVERRVQDVARAAAHRRQAAQPRHAALRRPDAARGDRPRAGAAPAIYLMDEPLSSLDAKLRAELRVELKRIQTELGATILYVTHDQIEAMTMAHAHRRPRSRPPGAGRHAARDLRGPGQHLCRDAPGQPGHQPDSAQPLSRRLSAPPQTATVGARTEHVRIRKSRNGSAVGQVTWIEHLGDQNHLHVAVGEQDFVTLADPDAGLSVGDTVEIEFLRPLFFDARRQSRQTMSVDAERSGCSDC